MRLFSQTVLHAGCSQGRMGQNISSINYENGYHIL